MCEFFICCNLLYRHDITYCHCRLHHLIATLRYCQPCRHVPTTFRINQHSPISGARKRVFCNNAVPEVPCQRGGTSKVAGSDEMQLLLMQPLMIIASVLKCWNVYICKLQLITRTWRPKEAVLVCQRPPAEAPRPSPSHLQLVCPPGDAGR